MSGRMLTVDEAAHRLGLTPQAIYHHVHRRTIPYRKLGTARNSRLRFDPTELDKWTRP